MVFNYYFSHSIKPDQAPAEYQRTAVHLVRPSEWPFLTAFSLGFLLLGVISYSHACPSGISHIWLSIATLIYCIYGWFSNIIYEAHYEGQHTSLVQKALRFGMFLFIISEVMFFFSFFWAFFHFSLSPSAFIFGVWPPVGIPVIDPWGIPFLNTLFLLGSGVHLTASHQALLRMNTNIETYTYHQNKNKACYMLLLTIVLGLIFTLCQLFEYITCPFSINDSVYGSIFFMATGFHGLHVLVGTVFLIVCYIRLLKDHFTASRHLGFECAAYYWHFVDVVWLFLFSAIYWWGS